MLYKKWSKWEQKLEEENIQDYLRGKEKGRVRD